MNKKEIKNKIKEAKEQIKDLQKTVNNLEEQLNKSEGRWKPEWNEHYYYIQPNGVTVFTNNLSDVDQSIVAIGNCFKTKEEAEFEVDRLKVLAELKEFAFEPDWKDGKQDKYALAYNHVTDEVDYCIAINMQRYNIYFETKEDVKNAIERVGKYRIMKFLFEVEK